MNKETLEVIRTMESKLIKAVSAVAGELEREAKPIAMNCETNAAKELLGRMDTSYVKQHNALGTRDVTYPNSITYLREAIQLLVAVNKRIDKLEEKLG